jgi:ParB-like chromosome segregation protein Spo0J
LLGLSEKGKQLQLARKAIDKGMSVRQVEDEVRRASDSTRPVAPRSVSLLDPDLLDEVREAFVSLCGLTASIRSKGTGGVVEVPFRDGDELRRMAKALRS